MVAHSPLTEEECGMDGEKEGTRGRCGHGESDPLADLAEVVGSRDQLEEAAPRDLVVGLTTSGFLGLWGGFPEFDESAVGVNVDEKAESEKANA